MESDFNSIQVWEETHKIWGIALLLSNSSETSYNFAVNLIIKMNRKIV
jgi:hypothetical protein